MSTVKEDVMVHLQGEDGKVRMEVSGNLETVKQMLSAYLSKGGFVVEDIQKKDAPSLDQNEDASSVNLNGLGAHPKVELHTFYHKTAPSTQSEQVATIIYYYQHHQDCVEVTPEQIRQAYNLLRRIPVEVPTNLKSTIQNTVNRTKWLYRSERGHYALTMAGTAMVESLFKE